MKNTVPLKKNFEFSRVYRQGKYKSGKYIVIYVRPNRMAVNRLGVTQVKKFGNSVQRNHSKRLLRESYRAIETTLQKGYDIVIVSRMCVEKPTFFSILKEMKYLISKLEIMENKSDDVSIGTEIVDYKDHTADT